MENKKRRNKLIRRAESFGLGSLQLRAYLGLLNASGALLRRRKPISRWAGFYYTTGLVELARCRRHWLRPLADWDPSWQTQDYRATLSSLANHLLAAYPVPEFMATAWLRLDDDGPAYRELWLHIGRGNNPRTGKTPVVMTRRVAHHFLRAPAHCSIEGAVRWGQVVALGGSPQLADACVATRLGEHFGNDAFWLSVIRWFIAHPNFDLAQVGPAVRFIRHVKFGCAWTRTSRFARIRFTPAPQPRFSMAGRTPESLLRKMRPGRAGLRRARDVRPAVPKAWPTQGIRPLRWKTTRRRVTTTWTTEELHSTAALEREGQEMRHCVASYAGRCAAGICSIWSLKEMVGDLVLERQTVKVSRERVIEQCLGKRNARPSGEVAEILRRWAAQEYLILPRWFLTHQR